MKTSSLLSLFLLASALAGAAEKPAAGPKGGRLLDTTPHAAEFFVTKERKVEVTFYDAARQPVAPGDRVVGVIAEPPAGRTPIGLEKTATGFVSTSPLPPAAEAYRVIVQIRADPGARPQNFRIDLKLETCGECQVAEYACVCAH